MSESGERRSRDEDAGQPAEAGITSPGDEPDRHSTDPWQAFRWLGLTLAGLVGMAQIGAIVQEVVPSGALSVTTLYAPGQVVSSFSLTSNALNTWANASSQFGRLWIWLYLHLLFDLIFIAGYALLGRTLLPRRDRLTQAFLIALISADLAEDLMAVLAFTRVKHHLHAEYAIIVLLHIATVAKWLAALVLLIRVAFLAWDHARAAIGRAFVALWEQRFSVVVVLFLAVLATGRGPDELEQMPDVQRSWLTTHGMGWLHAAVAVTAQLLLAVLLLCLGRMRTRRVQQKYSGKDGQRHDASCLPWILAPIAIGLLALGLGLAGDARIDPGRLVVFLAVPALVAVSSIVVSKLPWGGGALHPHPALESAASVDKAVKAARTAGEALAVAAIALTGLGLVRSFTAVAILANGGYITSAWVAVTLGIAVVTFVWPLANGPVRQILRALKARVGRAARSADAERRRQLNRLARWLPWLAAGTPFVIASALLLFIPLWTTHWLGVLGTTVIATGTLAVLLAALAYLAQTQRPLPVFRLLRLDVTPVITLVALIGLVGAATNSSPALHNIREPVRVHESPNRASLQSALNTWLHSSAAACTVPATASGFGGGPSIQVRPLILVAAAGGGIRAAWWTEHALADLAAIPCGRDDVFAVSSVSGGSLGMAVLDSAPTTQAANADMTSIAGPDALAAGIDGFLLHDAIAGFTGLNLAAEQMPTGQPFSDRAGLMESAWQREDESLGQAFPLRHPGLPWRLLFNSTDAGSGCRAIIADRSLSIEPSDSDRDSLTCDLRSGVPGGGSFDFFGKLPCERNIATVTAAMLSARFPYITPSGVITSCTSKGALAGQFVDGGYVDSSGLLTLADLIPHLMAAVRARNSAVMTRAKPGQPTTVVVPIVMYLGNSPRPAPSTTPVARIQETRVPLDAESAAGTQSATSDTLLERIRGLFDSRQWLQCTSAQAACDATESAVEQTVPYQVIFVSPRTEPRISAPLGWVLSRASTSSLDDALSEEENPASRCSKILLPSICPSGVGRIGDLFQLIKGD